MSTDPNPGARWTEAGKNEDKHETCFTCRYCSDITPRDDAHYSHMGHCNHQGTRKFNIQFRDAYGRRRFWTCNKFSAKNNNLKDTDKFNPYES